ncbi:MAG TPA: FAD-binding oxidoreductase [Candidatus Acidoferrum sp.]|jgi:glycine/D-amino acid oxidase-like deaminating enzyme
MSDGPKIGTDRRHFLKAAAVTGVAITATAASVNAIFPAVMPEKMVFEANHSYWAEALPPPNPALQKDIEADIAVIGGGFTGLSTAYYLKQMNASDRIVLLEAARCGNGASGRNGAMLLTSTEDSYLEWSGDPALDKRIYDLTVDNARRLLELSTRFNFDSEIECNGALQMCNSEELAEQARQYIRKAQRAGFPFKYWDRKQIAESVGTAAYPGATYDPNSGQAHPGKLVALFKAAAESSGVEIYESTSVIHVEEGERNSLVTASGKTIRARTLVLATNAYSSKLGYLRDATTPVFDYVAMTAPLSEARLSEIGWKKRIPFNDSRTEVFYLGLTKDNRIHIGGGPVDYVFNNGLREPAGSEKRFVGLGSEMARIFPSLAEEPFETTWSGSVDMSLDQKPAVGQMGKHGNLFYAIGFSGHGLNLTSVFGRILANLIHGKTKEWSWLPYVNRMPLYTPNEPFRWLGVQAALGYYRITDPKQP